MAWMGCLHLNKNDMKLVNDGITRHVIVTRKYAIKFPRLNYGWYKFIAGILANLSEKSTWEVCHHESLCPVLWGWAGFILIMPRVQVDCSCDEIRASMEIRECDDFHEANYGRLNGKIVCIDYATSKIFN